MRLEKFTIATALGLSAVWLGLFIVNLSPVFINLNLGSTDPNDTSFVDVISTRKSLLLISVRGLAVLAALWIIRAVTGKLSFSFILFNCLMCLALLEVTVLLLLSRPDILRHSGLRPLIRQVYLDHDMNIIHFEPECMEYNAELTYQLRQSACTFRNREFKNTFRGNSAGFRDDENSLLAPEIIVVGDSQSMGWGVAYEDTYAQILERTLSKKVLNTAISSYGTAREMKTLDRVDTSALQYLIVQYCDNDAGENHSFYVNGNKLPIMSEEEYVGYQDDYLNNKRYWPGRFAVAAMSYCFHNIETTIYNSIWGDKEHKLPSGEAVKVFLNALEHGSSKNLRDVSIIVMDHCSEGTFIPALKQSLAQSSPQFCKKIIPVRIGDRLTLADQHPLDGHFNNKGNQIIASILSEKLIRDSEGML